MAAIAAAAVNRDVARRRTELPLSRKPGFSKKALANGLHLSGLEYVHMVELGCPRPVRDGYRADGDWKRYTTRFLEYLRTQKDAVAELVDLAQSSTCALLCYEADFNFCHPLDGGGRR